jgi:hypothetical protein
MIFRLLNLEDTEAVRRAKEAARKNAAEERKLFRQDEASSDSEADSESDSSDE